MKMVYVLGGAVLAAAAFGFADHARRPVAAEALAPEPAAAPVERPVMAPSPSDVTADGPTVTGKVLETMDVAKYTYLRLATAQGETWAAVSKAPVTVGSTVTVTHAARMENFASSTLKRTFEVIYFGALPGAASGSNLPPGHPAIGASGEQPINGHVELGQDPGIPAALLDNSAAMPAGAERGMAAAHPETPSSSPIEVPKLARAPGPNAYVIADIFANAKKLAGQRVRVRGMVTKVTVGVLGQNFLHIRDGSGDDAAKTNDLAVTTKAEPGRSDVVIFEGTLRLDADLGIGYRYPALLENATVVDK